jgi:hypothetical protein
MAEHLSSMQEALGSVSVQKKIERERENNESIIE